MESCLSETSEEVHVDLLMLSPLGQNIHRHTARDARTCRPEIVETDEQLTESFMIR